MLRSTAGGGENCFNDGLSSIFISTGRAFWAHVLLLAMATYLDRAEGKGVT